MTSNWDWVEYNTLAQQIINIAVKEPYDFNLVSEAAIYRCVISRAYYSAHCQAVNYLKNIEFTTPSGKDIGSIHQWTIDKFDPDIYNFTKDIRNIKRYVYQDLYFLRKQRVLADYKQVYLGLKLSLANQCIERSHLVSEKLIKLSHF